MRIRLANQTDYLWVKRVMGKKDITWHTPQHVERDYFDRHLYVVVEGEQVLATFALANDWQHETIALKRLCVLNKKNQGKGIARFIIHWFANNFSSGNVLSLTPWENNHAMRHILETEGFTLEYMFTVNWDDNNWCFYTKEM